MQRQHKWQKCSHTEIPYAVYWIFFSFLVITKIEDHQYIAQYITGYKMLWKHPKCHTVRDVNHIIGRDTCLKTAYPVRGRIEDTPGHVEEKIQAACTATPDTLLYGNRGHAAQDGTGSGNNRRADTASLPVNSAPPLSHPGDSPRKDPRESIDTLPPSDDNILFCVRSNRWSS